MDAVHTSLAGPLSARLRNSVDLLIFNPPYVPTESEEAQQGQELGEISSSWAGGFDGMEVTNKLLGESEVRKDLLPGGLILSDRMISHRPCYPRMEGSTSSQ